MLWIQEEYMDPYLGEILLVAFGFAPKGWYMCQGQYLAIAQNQALFTLLGTTYGGDGMSTFRLPTMTAPTGMNYIICAVGVYPTRD
jgi:microcystin-dependent protein